MIKKIIPYILILILITSGFLGFTKKIDAANGELGVCKDRNGNIINDSADKDFCENFLLGVWESYQPSGTCKFYSSNGVSVVFACNKKVDCDAKGIDKISWEQSSLAQCEAELIKYYKMGTCITKNPSGEVTKREKTINSACDRPLGGETKRWLPDDRENMLGVCEDNKKLINGNITKKICEELLLGTWRLSAADAADLGEDSIPLPREGDNPPGGGITVEPKGSCSFPLAEGQQGPQRETQSNKTKKECDTLGGTWISDAVYHFLAPLPCTGGPETGCIGGELKTFDPTGANKIGGYLNLMINLFIGICAVLAVIMIVMGGLEYMTSELISSKEHGKERITSAIFGLILALGAWTILYTINPDLLNTELTSLKNVEVTVKIEPLYDRGANDPKQANGESTRCTPVLSGPCSVANLTPIFGDKAVAMSKICNMESGGTNAPSGTDVCKPGNNSFSFGLFQVNLAANGILAGADCVGLFDKKVSGADAISPKYTSGFSCSLLSGKETLYNTCKARLLDSNTNLAIAKSLFSNPSGINNWIGDKKYCASAFK